MANVDEAPAACLVACVGVCGGGKEVEWTAPVLALGGRKGDGRVDKHAAPLL